MMHLEHNKTTINFYILYYEHYNDQLSSQHYYESYGISIIRRSCIDYYYLRLFLLGRRQHRRSISQDLNTVVKESRLK
jgi:hypothetical protein